MQISVALNGSLQRDLIFPPGDDLTITLTVYQNDGDTTPLVVTNPQLATGGGAFFPIGSQFTIGCVGRTPYRLAVDIAGVTTTVAYGYIESPYPGLFTYNCSFYCCCGDELYPPVIMTGQASNILVSDSAQYFLADDVEDALAELARGQRNGTRALQSLAFQVGDETTNITTGVAKLTQRAPFPFTITGVRASLSTAQASGVVLTVDVNVAGVSILSTKLTFDNTEKTTTTAAIPPVVTGGLPLAVADDAEITIDVDQVGTAGARGLKVQLVGYPT